jgi:hypothetical protein
VKKTAVHKIVGNDPKVTLRSLIVVPFETPISIEISEGSSVRLSSFGEGHLRMSLQGSFTVYMSIAISRECSKIIWSVFSRDSRRSGQLANSFRSCCVSSSRCSSKAVHAIISISWTEPGEMDEIQRWQRQGSSSKGDRLQVKSRSTSKPPSERS